MADKPLHVQTAEALGWTECHDRGDGLYLGIKPGSLAGIFDEVPAFDRSWCSTGPIIQKMKIDLQSVGLPENEKWMASDDFGSSIDSTPLKAVCNVIVSRHQEDKIPA